MRVECSGFDRVNIRISLAEARDVVLEEQGVEPELRGLEWHRAKVVDERVHAALPLLKVTRVVPARGKLAKHGLHVGAVYPRHVLFFLRHFDWRQTGHVRDEEVHQNVFAVGILIHTIERRTRNLLKEPQIIAVDEGGSRQDDAVLVAPLGSVRPLQS